MPEAVDEIVLAEAADMRRIAQESRRPKEGLVYQHPNYQAHMSKWASSLEMLASADGSAAHRWVIKRRKAPFPDPRFRGSLFALPRDLHALAHHMASWSPIDRWQAAPAADRRAYCMRVSGLARDLAAALSEDSRPPIPNAFALFDNALIEAALESDPSYRPRPVRIDGSNTEARGRVVPRWPRPLNEQRIEQLLFRLADHIEASLHIRVPDARPKTGNSNQRALARHLAVWFEDTYNHVPNGVVADLVNLMLPSGDPPATDISVREWRGKK